MLDYSLKNYVSSEKASVTACIKGGFHLVKKTGVDYVKEESREYLEALSRQVTLSVIWFCQVLL